MVLGHHSAAGTDTLERLLPLLLDIFSRYAVGWMVAERENATLAATLIEQTCLKQGIEPQVLTQHSDRDSGFSPRARVSPCVDFPLGSRLSEPTPQTAGG